MKWIKWSDKKPAPGSIVLVVHCGQLNIGICNRSGANYRYITSAINDRELVVTHWIYTTDVPLPQPPEE